MPEFQITAPDGKQFRVTAPKGATRQQALEKIKAQYQSAEQEDPVFFGLPKETIQAIKSKVPDIEGWKPPRNEQEAFDRKFNQGISGSGSPQEARQAQQMRLANLERIRLENPAKAELIEGLSPNEQDLIGIGRKLSTIGSGVKRAVGAVDDQELAKLKEDTALYDELTGVKPRVALASGMTEAPFLVAGGSAMNLANVPARIAATTAVGASEGGIPSLGAGEDLSEAAKKAAIGAGLNVVGGELSHLGKPTSAAAKVKEVYKHRSLTPKATRN